jgi:hypothetical protein
VTASGAEGFDVGAGGLRHPQPVQREQGDQRVLGGGAEPDSDEQGSDFVAVQAGGSGFVVDPRSADVRCRGMVEQVFLDRVPVQARDGGQPAGDGGAGASGSFEVAGEQLDVSTARREQAQLPLAVPGGELAQIQRVSLPVMPEYPANASFSASVNADSITARAADDGIVVMGYLPRVGRDRQRSRQRMTTST